LNAREQFASIAQSELGRRWKQARMDLWYYFLHRGLDLLKPGARLSFIVNSYWTASASARRLIDRLERETTIEELVLLGNAPLFPDVAGNHMIFRLRRGKVGVPCRVRNFAPDATSRGKAMRSVATINAVRTSSHSRPHIRRAASYRLAQAELFDGNRLLVHPAEPWMSRLNRLPTLGERFDVRQGMAENPPKIGPRAARNSAGRFRAGEGVFVLSDDEIESLGLSPPERELLRPYFAANDVQRYFVKPVTRQKVLYLTRRTVHSLESLPAIERHLQRFRDLLERRREVRLKKIHWWELHWPREEHIFVQPRILAAQMGREPRFAFAEHPTFVGFSTNIVFDATGRQMPLAALTGVLNSTLAKRWFERHAKRRGVHLELNGETLRRFRLPERNSNAEERLAALVLRRQSMPPRDADVDGSSHGKRLEREIDELVLQLYGIDPDQMPSRGI
jgi:hypothetical protein